MFGFKSLKEKTLLSVMSSAVVLACVPAVWAASGNGGGYNGPSLSSQSIPIALDRGITVENAGEAIRICLLDGDSQAGLKSVTDRLIQVLDRTPSQPPFKRARWRKPQLSSTRDIEVLGSAFWSVTQNNKVDGWISAGTSGYFAISGSRFGLADDEYLTFKVNEGFPQIRYDSIQIDRAYDDFGRPAEVAHILKGVSIVLPSDYGTKVPLFNVWTGKRTSLTVNEVEYVQCLQSQIQRLAE